MTDFSNEVVQRMFMRRWWWARVLKSHRHDSPFKGTSRSLPPYIGCHQGAFGSEEGIRHIYLPQILPRTQSARMSSMRGRDRCPQLCLHWFFGSH